MDAKYPIGLNMYPPHKNAPDFIKAALVIKVVEFTGWLEEHANGKGEVRLDLKEGRNGALYLQLNTFTKEAPAPASEEISEEIPF